MNLLEYIRERRTHSASDRAEILAYIRKNPGCKTYDVELECHQAHDTVEYHLRKLREDGQIKNGLVAV